MKVHFSLEANEDLRELIIYIAQDSLESALRLADDIEQFCYVQLADNPNLGRPYDNGLRLFVKRGYRIFYRVNDTQIDIVRVLHSAQDSDRIMS